jgi:hypothetical protein
LRPPPAATTRPRPLHDPSPAAASCGLLFLDRPEAVLRDRVVREQSHQIVKIEQGHGW